MTKTFRFVGVSNLNGRWAVRYANEKTRARVLAKNGHTHVKLWDLKEALRAEDLVDELLNKVSRNEIEGAASEAVLEEARRLGFAV
jgi:hypothetical protein